MRRPRPRVVRLVLIVAFTAVLSACRGCAGQDELGNLSMVRDLLRGGARVNDLRGARWQPPVHASLGICGLPPEGPGENDNYRVALLRTLITAGADTTAKNAQGRTPIEVVTLALAQTHEPFYQACMQAKLDYLGTRR